MSKIKFKYYKYTDIPQSIKNELYKLRKEVFKDRLDWQVEIKKGHEIDTYDNDNATYLLGFYNNILIAGARFISTIYPYMAQGPFEKFFNKPFPCSHDLVESSRFFIDKSRVIELKLQHQPLTALLLLFMHEYAKTFNFSSIVTIVSKPMTRIVKNNGWNYQFLDSGDVNPNETIFFIDMPVNSSNYENIFSHVKHKLTIDYTFSLP
ncbi:acyl-homoserine-lactone synthase [Utexia brackfieldae]|uniref:acyl-homoserine-lactone synthase n=1 Tax=Utexia brackfieldae TaxID=3074108 RepID=UPI00370D4A82